LKDRQVCEFRLSPTIGKATLWRQTATAKNYGQNSRGLRPGGGAYTEAFRDVLKELDIPADDIGETGQIGFE